MNEQSPGRDPAAQSNTNEEVTAAVFARGLTKTYPASGKTPAVQALRPLAPQVGRGDRHLRPIPEP